MAAGIIPGSEVQTPIGGVQIDPTAFRNAALMRGKVAATIGDDASGFLQDLATNMQNARNAKTVFKADLAMKQAYSNFTLQLQKDPELNDPEKWLPAWSQQVDQIKESVLNQKNLGPAVKAHLERMTGNWEQQTTKDVQMNALKRESADTKAAGLKDANWNYSNGDLAAGDAGIDAMLEAKVLPGPKTAAALKRQGQTTWVLSQANSAISTAGYKAPDVLKQVLDANPGLVPAKQARILTDNALAAQRRAQSDKEQQVRDMVISDPSHALEDSRIDGMKKEGIISDRGAADLRTLRDNFAKKDKEEQAKQETQELSMAMMDVDNQSVALTGPGGKDKADQFKAQGNSWTDAAKKKRLDDYVDRKLSIAQKEAKTAETPVERDAFQQLQRESNEFAQSREFLDRREGKFVVTDEQLKAYGIEPGERTSAAEKRKLIAAKQHDNLRDFFTTYAQTHPGKQPSEQDTLDAIHKILAPTTEARVKAALTGGEKIMGARWNVGDIAHDKNGNKARWDGEKWVEVK
jgi:hypothetical protein